ncbi:MAG: TonB-dependent receptor [Sphingobium sp.]|nr:TonB-dependent receptor [Sphingobium sp.]
MSVSAIALLFTQQAYAQDESANSGADNYEIIVTAQKRAQSLQDVSVAVSAVTSDALVNAGISNLQDMQQLVPAVTFGNDFNQAKVFIRGVGANTSTTGSSTGVALHVDGAYVARAEAQLTSLFDVERVEVLRGPQGSLYGRNAVGGSINIITAKPTAETSGYARFGYGNYNALTAEAAISGSLADWLRVRVAAKSELRDGYGEDPVHKWDVDDLNRKMVRGQAQILFSDRADLLLSAEYFRQKDNSGAVHYYGDAFPGVARLQPLAPAGIAKDPRDLGSDEPPSVDTKSQSYTATLNWELSDNFSISNIANYRDFKTQLIQDLDISSTVSTLPNATTMQTRTVQAKQWSNEFQVKYDGDIMNAVVGLYYFGEHQRPRDQVGYSTSGDLPSTLTFFNTKPVRIDGRMEAPGYFSLADALDLCDFPAGTIPNRVCVKSRLNTEAYAAFGQLNFDLEKALGLNGLTLKLGGRYSHEKVSTTNRSMVMTANANPAAATGIVQVGTDADVSQGGTYNEKTFKDFTPEIGLSWKPNNDMLFYYTYSEGFKAGSGENAAFSSTIVKPETMKNHEVGMKLDLLDRKLTFNIAGYYYKLNDLQINKTIGGGPTGYTTIFENAAKTEAKGIEIDWMLRPVHRVRLSGAVSYTDSKYKDFVTLDPLDPRNVDQPGQPRYDPVTNPSPTAFGAPCLDGTANVTGCYSQLSGNATRNSPKWAYNVHAEVDVIDGPVGVVTLSGDMSGKSNVYFTEFNRLSEGAKAYQIYDASLRWTSAKKDLTASLWVKNIADTLRASSSFAISTGRVIGATWLPPRTYGLTLGYRY